MIDFNRFLDNLKEELKELATQLGEELKDEFIEDGVDFAHQAREDLIRWSLMAKTGQLTDDEFTWLLESKKDLAEMNTLKKQGLARASLDRYRHALFQAVAGSVFKVVR